jgi:nitrogen fixation NifU-like protein
MLKMAEEPNDFWQNHSLHYLEMALRTDHHEEIRNPDGYGKRTGVCNDTIEMALLLDGDRIKTVSFATDGCLNTNACANTVAHLVEGRTVEKAWEITPEKVADFLETLPKDHFHCAELAVGALYLALANCRENQSAPWKKLYG